MAHGATRFQLLGSLVAPHSQAEGDDRLGAIIGLRHTTQLDVATSTRPLEAGATALLCHRPRTHDHLEGHNASREGQIKLRGNRLLVGALQLPGIHCPTYAVDIAGHAEGALQDLCSLVVCRGSHTNGRDIWHGKLLHSARKATEAIHRDSKAACRIAHVLDRHHVARHCFNGNHHHPHRLLLSWILLLLQLLVLFFHSLQVTALQPVPVPVFLKGIEGHGLVETTVNGRQEVRLLEGFAGFVILLNLLGWGWNRAGTLKI
mmetsp:Transcript_72705/g.160532  ORF Transcript_72705/g.160532 Transcript_72705/m.160532 type:complete len:261 (-) Transcript_72705:269-1051(-)